MFLGLAVLGCVGFSGRVVDTVPVSVLAGLFPCAREVRLSCEKWANVATNY